MGKRLDIKIIIQKEYIFGRKLPYILLLVFSIPAILWRLIQLAIYTELSIYKNILDNIMLLLIFIYTFIYTIVGTWLLRYHFPVELAMFIFLAETIVYLFNKIRFVPNGFILSMKVTL